MKQILLGILIAFIAGAMLFAYMEYSRITTEPLSIKSDSIVIEVEAGQSLWSLANKLENQNVLRNARDLVVLARLKGQADKIKAGEYQIASGSTAASLLELLVAGKVLLHTLTIVEGSTFKQLMALLRTHPAIRQELGGLSDADIMSRLGYPEQHPEGNFFPDTYHFPRGTTDVEFLKRAFSTMQEKLQEAWSNRESDLPLKTPYEALILASIVEKETGLESERAMIAGVFIRRLRLGMRLQTDPTVIYGIGESFDGDIRFRDLRRDTPYNTYTRRGLPPTPIAMPGAASLAAVMHPNEGDSLYFVATGDGGHKFSASLEEHNEAVRKYQKRRRN
ncbi:MAG: endolytic transglycosylase MltG [Gammaproteobacteria bacterium]|nr:endolytic transglycosylase MltG [Gammaproteobacteria bacterium]